MSTPVVSRSFPVPARALSDLLEKETKSQPRLHWDRPRSDQDLEQNDSITDILPRLIPSSHAWKLYFTQEIAFDWFLSAQMYVLTLGTGLLDATTYNAYRVFATKMTGNLLLLAVDAVDRSALSAALEQNVATAIGCFIAGAAAFGHIGRLVGRRRRLFLLISNLLQTALIFAATAIQHWSTDGEVGPHAIIKMAVLAFAMAGQVSLAIGVGLPDLNTTMITSSLIQLCYDPKIFKLHNRPRTKRLAFIIIMAAGHFAGAAASRRSITLGILLAACVKLLVTLSFLFNPGMVKKAADHEQNPGKMSDGTVTPVVQVLWGD